MQSLIPCIGIFALNKKLGPPFPVYAIISDLSQFFYYYYTGTLSFYTVGSSNLQCHVGDEYMSMGNFELPAKVDFDIETANSLTTIFMLSSCTWHSRMCTYNALIKL